MRKNITWETALAAALFVLILLAIRQLSLSGDGGEYLLTTHALFRHASFHLTPADFHDYLQRGQDELVRIGFSAPHYSDLLARVARPHPVPHGGFASVTAGEIHAIHFWLYSLLALPFYAVLYPAGLNPVLALGLVNAGAVLAVWGYACSACGRSALLACALFLLCGTTFYLKWTGPEVLSASCVLISCLAIWRRDTGAALLAAGAGAAQNPSIVLLMPAAVCAHLAIRFIGGRPPRTTWRSWAMAALGCALALAPFVYFKALFGVFSLTGKYFTLPELISADRLVSLLFDLDQGVVVGMPGLFALLIACTCLVGRGARLRWLALAGAALLLSLLLAIPTLSAINWNSGGVVLNRYGYWAAMPLLAACLAAIDGFGARAKAVCLAAMLVPQALVWSQAGVAGERTSYVRHTRQAAWVLSHGGARYHPDPEIFYERTVGHEVEAPLATDLTAVFSSGDAAHKALANLANPAPRFALCGPDQRLRGSARTVLARGWYYEHAPFACEAVPRYVETAAFVFARPDADTRMLAEGWSDKEPLGVWTSRPRSMLRLDVPAGPGRVRLRLLGQYYLAQNASRLVVNGRRLPDTDLSHAVLELPAGTAARGVVAIELEHPFASSPKQHGQSQDERLLGFFLRELHVDVER